MRTVPKFPIIGGPLDGEYANQKDFWDQTPYGRERGKFVDPAMIVQGVEMAVREGEGAAFEAAPGDVRQRAFMSPGFRRFTVSQGVERPAHFLVQVLWEAIEELGEFESVRFDRCWPPGSSRGGPLIGRGAGNAKPVNEEVGQAVQVDSGSCAGPEPV